MNSSTAGNNNNVKIIGIMYDNFSITIDETNSTIEEFNNLKVGNISGKILNII